MIEIKPDNRKKYEAMFSSCEDSCIITALEGYSGSLFVDKEEADCALIMVGNYAFLAGDASIPTAAELISFIDSQYEEGFNIRCVNPEYVPLIEKLYKGRIRKYSRFATKRSFDNMDFEALKEKVDALPKEYELVPLDAKLYDFCKNTEWAKNFTISFDSVEEWMAKGLGFMIMKGDEPVAGASSYSSYPRGIEVEIITRNDHRGKGFAQITGAALLIECKKRGILASWDAAHEQSLRLANKLGFELLYKYDCYYIEK